MPLRIPRKTGRDWSGWTWLRCPSWTGSYYDSCCEERDEDGELHVYGERD